MLATRRAHWLRQCQHRVADTLTKFCLSESASTALQNAAYLPVLSLYLTGYQSQAQQAAVAGVDSALSGRSYEGCEPLQTAAGAMTAEHHNAVHHRLSCGCRCSDASMICLSRTAGPHRISSRCRWLPRPACSRCSACERFRRPRSSSGVRSVRRKLPRGDPAAEGGCSASVSCETPNVIIS